MNRSNFYDVHTSHPGLGAAKTEARETRSKWLPLEYKKHVEKILSRADIKIDGNREWDIRVRDDRFYGTALLRGSLGLGESYVDGWWDCPSLDQFFARVLSASLDRNPLWSWRSGLRWFISSSFNRQTRSRATRVAKQHYDLGNNLYQSMLDHRMVYTCARWQHADNLDDAQEAKLDFVCRKLKLRPGMRILDIGCGWGSLLKFAAEKYDVKAVGITLSEQQLLLARERCAGLRVDICLRDYRDVEGVFDRVVSLGMFEHVGYANYRKFFEVAHRCLRSHGYFFLSSIGSNHSKHATDPWIEKYIFPNSYIPSAAEICRGMEGLFAIEGWENWADDYDRTLQAWFQNFQGHWQELEPRYGPRFYRMWKCYLMLAAGTFRARTNHVWEILMVRE